MQPQLPHVLTCNGGSSSFFALGLPCGWRIRVQGIALRRNSRCAASSESLAWCRSKSAKQVEPSIKSRLVHHALACSGGCRSHLALTRSETLSLWVNWSTISFLWKGSGSRELTPAAGLGYGLLL